MVLTKRRDKVTPPFQVCFVISPTIGYGSASSESSVTGVSASAQLINSVQGSRSSQIMGLRGNVWFCCNIDFNSWIIAD
jgi:hypothetical protein